MGNKTSLSEMFMPSRKQTMSEIIGTLLNMEPSKLESLLEATKEIAKAAAKQERSDYPDPLPPINLEYTAVDVPLYSSDNGNGKPNPQVRKEPKLADDTHNVVQVTGPASVEPSVDDKPCKQKLRVDAEFMQQYDRGLEEKNTVKRFIEVWEARMDEREKRKKLWKPYENETHQLLEQSLPKINEINQENFQWLSFYNAALGEKQCSDWLEAVRAPIARVKQHYLSLPHRSDYQNYLKELFCLHGYSLVAWLTVFRACQRIKMFSVEMQTDFLQRMLRNLVTVSDQLSNMLVQIDHVLTMGNKIPFLGTLMPRREQIMREIIEILWNMDLSKLESSLKAFKDIAKSEEERHHYTDPLPPINLEYTSVEVPLCSSDNGKPNPQVRDEPKLIDDTQKVVHEVAGPEKQKLRVDVEFIQNFYMKPEDEEVLNQFIHAWKARMKKREKRKKLWKPYENETHQLLEQSLAKINGINQENFQWLSFYNTTLGERQCADWLEAVREPIVRVKQHYLSLPHRSDYQNYLKELFCFHGYTLVAWLTVYKACQRVKTFSVQMKTDFTRRMLCNLVSVSDKLFFVLGEIDFALMEYPFSEYFPLKSLIVEPTEIMTPSDLRRMKKSSNEDGAIKEPYVYQNRFINIKDFI